MGKFIFLDEETLVQRNMRKFKYKNFIDKLKRELTVGFHKDKLNKYTGNKLSLIDEDIIDVDALFTEDLRNVVEASEFLPKLRIPYLDKKNEVRYHQFRNIRDILDHICKRSSNAAFIWNKAQMLIKNFEDDIEICFGDISGFEDGRNSDGIKVRFPRIILDKDAEVFFAPFHNINKFYNPFTKQWLTNNFKNKIESMFYEYTFSKNECPKKNYFFDINQPIYSNPKIIISEIKSFFLAKNESNNDSKNSEKINNIDHYICINALKNLIIKVPIDIILMHEIGHAIQFMEGCFREKNKLQQNRNSYDEMVAWGRIGRIKKVRCDSFSDINSNKPKINVAENNLLLPPPPPPQNISLGGLNSISKKVNKKEFVEKLTNDRLKTNRNFQRKYNPDYKINSFIISKFDDKSYDFERSYSAKNGFYKDSFYMKSVLENEGSFPRALEYDNMIRHEHPVCKDVNFPIRLQYTSLKSKEDLEKIFHRNRSFEATRFFIFEDPIKIDRFW